MSGLFSGDSPTVGRPEPTPKVEDSAVQEAAAEALRRRRRGRGYRNTVLRNMTDSATAAKLETLGS